MFGHTFDDSSIYKGNFLSMRASWNRNQADLTTFVGSKVSISVEMIDARLYSLVFTCEQRV